VARDYVDLLIPALPVLEPELVAGCVAAFERAVFGYASFRSRVRFPDAGLGGVS